MATHSSIPAWRIPWTEEPSGLQSTGSERVGYNSPAKYSTQYVIIKLKLPSSTRGSSIKILKSLVNYIL